jgi:hypothetical protein
MKQKVNKGLIYKRFKEIDRMQYKSHLFLLLLCINKMFEHALSIVSRSSRGPDRTGRWYSPGPVVSFTNNTDRHDITEILLKVALNTKTPSYGSWIYNYLCNQCLSPLKFEPRSCHDITEILCGIKHHQPKPAFSIISNVETKLMSRLLEPHSLLSR